MTGAAGPERSAIREADLCVLQDENERIGLQVKGREVEPGRVAGRRRWIDQRLGCVQIDEAVCHRIYRGSSPGGGRFESIPCHRTKKARLSKERVLFINSSQRLSRLHRTLLPLRPVRSQEWRVPPIVGL